MCFKTFWSHKIVVENLFAWPVQFFTVPGGKWSITTKPEKPAVFRLCKTILRYKRNVGWCFQAEKNNNHLNSLESEIYSLLSNSRILCFFLLLQPLRLSSIRTFLTGRHFVSLFHSIGQFFDLRTSNRCIDWDRSVAWYSNFIELTHAGIVKKLWQRLSSPQHPNYHFWAKWRKFTAAVTFTNQKPLRSPR